MSPPPGGRRTALVTYNWGAPGTIAGGQDMVARFAPAFDVGGLFSPGQPLVPPDAERTRVWDFPVGVNVIYTPRASEPLGFEELRALAESHDITRLAIETRKDQIEKLDWRIRPRGGRAAGADVAARVEELTRFWQRPDGDQPFATWLRKALEDLLVLDAPTFEIRRNRGGAVIGLDVVDGATIKVLVDDTGRRPRPPAPAFEQVIHGRPWRLLTGDELLYAPRNVRPHKAYGYSPVEQIVTTVNIALRRQLMQLQHFTAGNVPPGLLSAPEGWNAEQIKQFQEWFDAMLGGNTAERTKLVWGPSGTRYQAFKEAPYKDDFDEWLARIVCYAFSLPPTAFTREVNRATAETTQEAALTEGLAPLMGWVKRLCDGVIQDRMGHPDLEFAWSDVQTIDPKEQATILQTYVKEGIKTRNEARAILGDAPLPGADALTVDTPQGPLKLTDAPPPAPVAKAGYSPDEPRDWHGRWTTDGGDARASAAPSEEVVPLASNAGLASSSDADRAPALTPIAGNSEPPRNGPFRPGGSGTMPISPLDPQGLNTEPSAAEQQRIADTLNAIVHDDIAGLHPHPYRNFPHRETGAVLPPSPSGYTTFDLRSAGDGRGLERIVIDNATGVLFYTNNHYKSFYPLVFGAPP